MMKPIANLPDNVVGVSAWGQIDAKDYETVLIPAIDAAFQKHGRIRMLYQITAEYAGFTAGAMWDDAKVGLAHWKSFERVAMVTDVPWIAHAVRMFKFMMPGAVKVFSNNELADAKTWIAA